MAYLALSIYFLLFCVLLKYGRVGPILLVGSYSLVSILVFFLNDTGLVYFEPYRGLPLPLFGDYLYADNVYIVSMLFGVFCLFFTFYFRRKSGGYTLRIYIEKLIKTRHSSRFVVMNYVVLTIFMLLYLWHIFEVDFDPILSNTAYLFNVSPANVGAESPIARLVHHLTGPASLFFSFMLAYYIKAKRYDMFVVLFLLFAYSIFIKSSQFSRWLPLVFACLGISIFMIFESRKKYIGSLFSVLLCLFCFILVIKGRGSYEQGFVGFVSQIESFTFADLSYLNNLIINVFGGYIAYAEALETGWVYEMPYIIRSFSPFPSFIDGWQQYVGNAAVINIHAPFNAMAELYYFGVWYSVPMIVMFFVSLIRIEHIHRTFSSAYSIVGFVIFLYVFLAVFFYPVRNVFRVYLICLLIYEASVFFTKTKKTAITNQVDGIVR